jgi:hypothetical protein
VLTNDRKQELDNESMPERTSALRDTIGRTRERLRGSFKQTAIDFALN